MSTIDKALPNVVETSVTTPSEEEVALAEEKVAESQGGEGVDIQENEDGSVDVNFEPNKINQEGTDTHFDNLADILPDDIELQLLFPCTHLIVTELEQPVHLHSAFDKGHHKTIFVQSRNPEAWHFSSNLLLFPTSLASISLF